MRQVCPTRPLCGMVRECTDNAGVLDPYGEDEGRKDWRDNSTLGGQISSEQVSTYIVPRAAQGTTASQPPEQHAGLRQTSYCPHRRRLADRSQTQRATVHPRAPTQAVRTPWGLLRLQDGARRCSRSRCTRRSPGTVSGPPIPRSPLP